MIEPIYRLLFGQTGPYENFRFLDLTPDQVTIKYKTYRSNKAKDLKSITDNKLTPGDHYCKLSEIQIYV